MVFKIVNLSYMALVGEIHLFWWLRMIVAAFFFLVSKKMVNQNYLVELKIQWDPFYSLVIKNLHLKKNRIYY